MADDAINRSDLIQAMCVEHNIEKDIAENSVRSMLNCMSRALQNGQRIEVRGFGSFEVRHRPPHLARNPKTGEQVMTSDRFSIHFKPGKDLRERVDQSAKEHRKRFGDLEEE